MLGIIDYGAGNLRSVCNALDRLDRRYRICIRREHLDGLDHLVLPGVGQFASAMRHLRTTGLDEAIRTWSFSGKPLLGICLGLQILFERSEESPDETGLGLLPGVVTRLKSGTVPHMGWNKIEASRSSHWVSPSDSQHFYFAHSYIAPMQHNYVVGTVCIDDAESAAVVERGPIRAVQFHPEKSAAEGDLLLDRMLTC